MTFRPRHISEEDFKVFENRVRGGLAGPGIGGVVTKVEGVTVAANSTRSRVGNPAPSPFRSKWEAAYASKLEMEKRVNHVKQYWYEPFSLWLPGKVRFKPDFLVQYQDNVMMEIIEVKGWSKNRRDGMTRLKIAASLFPCFVWRLVYRTDGGGWSGEYV